MLNPLNCKQIYEKLHDYLDRELSASDMKVVAFHFKICPHCAREYRLEGRVLTHVKERMCCEPIPENLEQLIRAKLDEADES